MSVRHLPNQRRSAFNARRNKKRKGFRYNMVMRREKIKRFVVTALILLVTYLISCTLLDYIALGGIKPNLLLIVTASFGFMRGSREGMLTGFAVGLMLDIQFGSVIGFYALLYLLVGFFNGRFEPFFIAEDIKLPLFMTAVSEFLYGIAVYLFRFMLQSDFHFLYYLGRIILPDVIYTTVATCVVYPLILFINHKLWAEEKRSASKFV